MNFLRPPAVPGAERVLRRDAAFVAARSMAKALIVALGAQLVLRLGGGEGHVAVLYTSLFLGLLASGIYGGSAIAAPLRRTQALSWLALGAVGLLGLMPPGPRTTTLLAGLLAASGAFAGMGSPLISAAYARMYPAESRGRAVGWVRLIQGLSGLLCLLLLGKLFEVLPWSTWPVHALAAIVGLIATWRFCAVIVESPEPQQATGLRASFGALRDGPFARFQLFTFGMGMANLMANPLLAVYVSKKLELGLALAVLVVPQGAVEQGFTLATVRLHGRLYDRIGVVAHRTVSSSLIVAGFALWAYADDLWTAVIASVLVGVGRGGGQIIWLIGSLDFAPTERTSDYAAVHTLLTGVRGVIAPTLGLWMLVSVCDGDYRPMLLGCAALTAAATLGNALFVPPPTERDEPMP